MIANGGDFVNRWDSVVRSFGLNYLWNSYLDFSPEMCVLFLDS